LKYYKKFNNLLKFLYWHKFVLFAPIPILVCGPCMPLCQGLEENKNIVLKSVHSWCIEFSPFFKEKKTSWLSIWTLEWHFFKISSHHPDTTTVLKNQRINERTYAERTVGSFGKLGIFWKMIFWACVETWD
jgi:hypothetical protein